MALQKIPLELVAGDDRAFVVKVEKDGAPLDLVDADLRGELQTANGHRQPLTVVGGNGRLALVLRHADTENALWRTADADVRLVSENGVATLLALQIRLLSRVTRVDAVVSLAVPETEAATIRLEEGGAAVEIPETETGLTVQLDGQLRIVYAASDDSAVRGRLAALELRADSLDAAAAETIRLAREMADIKAQTEKIGPMDARLTEMAKAVSDGLLAQSQLADLRQRLDGLQAQIADKAAAADIVRLSGQIAEAQAGIDGLREAVQAAASAGAVVDLSQQIAQLQAQMATDKAALDALAEQVADGSRLATLAADVTTLSGKVDAAMQAADEIKLLQAAVAALQAESNKADDAVVTALAGRLAALETQVAGMPKYKEYQAGYIPRADFVGTLGNNVLITVNFPQPFAEKPLCFVLIDVKDAAARYQSVNNVTETGFQVALNYVSSMLGVHFMAFVPAN